MRAAVHVCVWYTIFHGVLYPPHAGLDIFIFDGCKVSLMRTFGAFHKCQSSLLHSGELPFSFSLLMCSSSRWSMMVKLFDSQYLPMEDPVSNMPAVAVVFGLGRALWTVWIRSQENKEQPKPGDGKLLLARWHPFWGIEDEQGSAVNLLGIVL